MRNEMTITSIRSFIGGKITEFGNQVGTISWLKRHPSVCDFLRLFLGVILGKQSLTREIVDGPLKGYKMVLGPNDRNQFLIGKYEKLIVDLVRQMAIWGMRVLDVGANVDKIKEMIRVNELKNVLLFSFAATDHSGMVDFHIERTGATGHIADDGNVTNKMTQTISVKAVRTDDFARGRVFKKIDLVKMDVEGAEKQVLLEMQDLLTRDKPIIICEWRPAVAGPDYMLIFESLGYKPDCLDAFSPTAPFHIMAKPV
jgi:FkbM family methyltransferase